VEGAEEEEEEEVNMGEVMISTTEPLVLLLGSVLLPNPTTTKRMQLEIPSKGSSYLA